jgi:hypothetical protein
MLELQAARLPLSNPSIKIRSLVPGVALAVGDRGVAVLVAGVGSTVSVELVDIVFVTPFEVANAPAGMVLVELPGVLEVTSIATVQEPGVDPT